jgi:spoIIIJ-associated protein
MRSIEIQARSLEDATQLALEQLGVKRDDVDVQILAQVEPDEYGEGEVLIRVQLRDGVEATRVRRIPGPGRPQDTRRHQQNTPDQRRGGQQRPPRRGNNDRGGQRRRPPVERLPVPARPPSTVTDETLQRYEAAAKQTVRELLDLMSIRADVIAVDNPSIMEPGPEEPPTVFVDINGPDLGMLIGRRGENLTQLQYMVNLLVNRELDEWVRVILDIEGYRTRREESLIGLAERVARQVARNRRPISLEPMPANERRIVHMALREQTDVRTESTGEGALRRVTVYPNHPA